MTDDERLGPPPVEPMSDVAWSRIERGLWSRMDVEGTAADAGRTPSAARRWWIVAAPIVAVAAAAAIVIGTRASPPEIAVTEEPARVVSGSAPSSVSFGDSHVELGAHTAVVMSHESGHPIVLLDRGAAWFTVAPRMQRPEFVVRAGDATVRVVGTRFRVARSDEQIAVDVEHGLVDVQFRGGVVKLGASQHWSSDAPGKISALAGTLPPFGPLASSEPIRPSTSPSTEPRSEPAQTPPEPKPAPKLAPRPDPKLGGTREAEADLKPDSKPDPQLGGTHVTDADRDRAEYDRLASLEPNDPDAALAGYLLIARGTSRWADLALFAAARLAADRHNPRAETLLGVYLVRFPSGANATDAKQLLARLKQDRP